MQSKNNAPTAAQKRWREAVRDLGSVISGGPAVIHHPVGVTGKHNKVHIGHWWVIPLTDEEHKALHNGTLDVNEDRKGWEKFMFSRTCMQLMGQCTDFPPDEAIYAIQDYRR
jgi:hypothetical protein